LNRAVRCRAAGKALKLGSRKFCTWAFLLLKGDNGDVLPAHCRQELKIHDKGGRSCMK